MLATTLAVLLAAASPAGGRASLIIDTSALREAGAGPAIAHQLRARAEATPWRAALATQGVEPRVWVTVRPLEGAAIGYASTVALGAGAGVGPATVLRCPLCTEGELVAQLSVAIERLTPGPG